MSKFEPYERENMSNVVALGRFRFDSLHKYMQAVYANLNLHCQDSEEQKKVILAESIRTFFIRTREYRGLTIESLSEKSGIGSPELEAFERGERPCGRQ